MATQSKATHEERLKLLDKVPLVDLGDYKVPRFVQYDQMPEFKEYLERFKQLEIGNNDVICVGYPRSGNHWAYEVMGMILAQNAEFKADNFGLCLVEVEYMPDQQPSPRQVVSHLRCEDIITKQMLEKKTKIVYLLRNPKDVLISWYRLVCSFSHDLERIRFHGTFDDFLQLDLAGEFYYGNWFDHVLSAEKFINDHPESPVYVHVYEEMKANPEESTRKLCRFLGYPEDIAVDISKKTKIEVMSQFEKFKEVEKGYFAEPKSLINKGQTGEWRNVLTDEQNRLIDEMFEKKMAGSKLGDLVRPYLKK